MSRPELIEIIYALKSNEESLQKKNAIVRFRFQRQALLQRLPFSWTIYFLLPRPQPMIISHLLKQRTFQWKKNRKPQKRSRCWMERTSKEEVNIPSIKEIRLQRRRLARQNRSDAYFLIQQLHGMVQIVQVCLLVWLVIRKMERLHLHLMMTRVN